MTSTDYAAARGLPPRPCTTCAVAPRDTASGQLHDQKDYPRHAIPGGDTMFLGMNEFLESMDEDLRALCERLWFVLAAE